MNSVHLHVVCCLLELAQEMEQQEGEEGSSNDEEHFKQASVEDATPSKSSVIGERKCVIQLYAHVYVHDTGYDV